MNFSGTTLRCWECYSWQKSLCGESFNTKGLSQIDRGRFLRDCSYKLEQKSNSMHDNHSVLQKSFDDDDSGLEFSCRKIVATVETKGRVYARECYVYNDAKAKDACLITGLPKEVQTIEVCIMCHTDGCNSAPAGSLITRIGLILLFLIVRIFQ